MGNRLRLPPHPFRHLGRSPGLNDHVYGLISQNNTIDSHRIFILTIVGTWPSIMGWMHFLNSDDIVAVLTILPFQDANAPAVSSILD